MRKEVILAVIIGIILGGVILYGINLANGTHTNKPQPIDTDTIVENEQNIHTQSQISIAIPQNNSVTTDSVTSLKGSTKPNSNLAIITENDDILTMTDEKGNFASTINLSLGENTITITLVDDQLATTSAKITVIRTDSLPE